MTILTSSRHFLNTPSQRKAVAQGTALEEIIVTATKRGAGQRWLECHPAMCGILTMSVARSSPTTAGARSV